MQSPNRFAQGFEGSAVVDYVVGNRKPRLAGCLGSHDLAYLIVPQSASPPDPGDLIGFRTVDDKHPLNFIAIAARLDQQGYHVDDIGPLRRRNTAP